MTLASDSNPAAVCFKNCLRDLERLAGSGEWSALEKRLADVETLAVQIPPALRGPLLREAQQQVETLHTHALRQNQEMTTQLSQLRSGRAATASYRQTSALIATSSG